MIIPYSVCMVEIFWYFVLIVEHHTIKCFWPHYVKRNYLCKYKNLVIHNKKLLQRKLPATFIYTHTHTPHTHTHPTQSWPPPTHTHTHHTVVTTTLNQLDFRVSENAGAVTLCVTKDLETANPFNVTLTTIDGSATSMYAMSTVWTKISSQKIDATINFSHYNIIRPACYTVSLMLWLKSY